MMKIKKIQRIICVAIFFLCSNHVWAADWIFLGASDVGDIYYDKSSVKKINKSMIRVWTKTILNKDGKRQYFLFLKSINEAPDKPDIINYELMLNEIDCAKTQGRFSSMAIHYDTEDIIYRGPTSFSQWMAIDSRSTMRILKNKVCSAGTKFKKNK